MTEEEEKIEERFEVHHYDGDIPVFVVQIDPGMETNPEMVVWLEKVVQLSCKDLGFDDDKEVRLEYCSQPLEEEDVKIYPY
jgi:hypothetical protein